MWGAKIFIITLFVAAATATLNVEVMLQSYSNPTSEVCDGGNCEFLLGVCDNEFTFCLRTVGSSSCLATMTTNDVGNDNFMFTSEILSELGISNPLLYSDLAVSELLELFVSIIDADFNADDPVDEILVPFNNSVRVSSTFSSPSTYTGVCGRASITISFRITSNCPANMYGPSCSELCVDETDQFYCNYLGERQCIGNVASDCTEDIPPPDVSPPQDDTPTSSAAKQFDIVVGIGVVLSLLTLIGT